MKVAPALQLLARPGQDQGNQLAIDHITVKTLNHHINIAMQIPPNQIIIQTGIRQMMSYIQNQSLEIIMIR